MQPGLKHRKQSVNVILTVLEIVSPVFLLAGLGYGWIRIGWDYPVGFVTRLAMNLAVPCLIFTALMNTEIDPAALTAVSLAAIVSYALIALVFAAVVYLSGLDQRTFLAPLTFGNTGNLGLPLALFAFGPEGLGYGVVILAVTSIGVFTLGLWLVAGGGSPSRMLREPMLVATLTGALFLSQGWHTPDWLTNALELLGQMAIPLMLLTLGVAVGGLRASQFAQSLRLSLLKAVVCGGVAASVGYAFGLPPVPLAVLVVQMITPVAVTSYLLAEKYGADSGAVAGLVVVSTVLSIAVLPIALAVFL